MGNFSCVDCGTRYDQYISYCSFCGSDGRIVMLGRRPSAQIDFEFPVTSAAALASSSLRITECPILEPIGDTPKVVTGHGALVVVTGPPGGGKSTFCASWLGSLSGPALLVASEEGASLVVGERLRRQGADRPDLLVVGRGSVDNVVNVAREHKIETLAIDSVQGSVWTASDLRHLLAVLTHIKLLIAVAQVNKAGVIEGRQALVHEADVLLRIENMTARLEKSRYQELKHGDGNLLRILPANDSKSEVGSKLAPVLILPRMRGKGISSIKPGSSDLDRDSISDVKKPS